MPFLARLRAHKRRLSRMIKRKLQDLTACCAYQVNFLHAKAHSLVAISFFTYLKGVVRISKEKNEKRKESIEEHDWRQFRRQYEIMEEIGRGGFGVVYAGTRVSDDAAVAIKFIEHRHVREWTLAGSHLIPSEVSHLEMCSDIDGVIRLHDWFANSKGFVVIMERPSSCCDVFDLVSRYGRLDEATARGIFKQVVDTVCQMYSRHGLIHRDIKDENIIVSMETGSVRLVDFGATASAEKAIKKEFQGTRSYCPPEWFRLLQYLPLEATSWSLGVLLHILVTGRLPFRNEVQACLGSISFPPYLSKECSQLIKRCLSTVPSQRATLLDIRAHPWVAAPVPLYNERFGDVLDRLLKPRKVTSTTREASIEENLLLEDKVLVEERGARLRRESTEYLEAAETLPGSMTRLASRYDNLSSCSLGDHSLASFATAHESFPNLLDVDKETGGISPLEEMSDRSLSKCRSLSAYSLNRRRRSLLPRASFERELDIVEEGEAGGGEEVPLLSEASFVPSISASASICLPSPPVEEIPVPRWSLFPEVEECCRQLAERCSVQPVKVLSRMRPLFVVESPPSLRVFAAAPRESHTIS